MSDATREDTAAAATASATEAATAATAAETTQTAAPADPAAAAPTNSETAPAAPQSQPSLLATAEPKPAPELSEAKPAEGEKPAEAKAPDPAEAKPAEAKPAEPAPAKTEAPAEAPPAPSYDPFELPEGVSLEADQMGRFTEELGKLELAGKVSHELVQKFGQDLVNLHVEQVGRAVDAIRQQQIEAWSSTNQRWQDEVKSDPAIGGNRLDTAMQVCGSVIEEFGGTRDPKSGEINKDEVKALREALVATGAGNHPAIVKFVHRIGEALGEGRPIAAPKPPPEQVRKADRLYNAPRRSA